MVNNYIQDDGADDDAGDDGTKKILMEDDECD